MKKLLVAVVVVVGLGLGMVAGVYTWLSSGAQAAKATTGDAIEFVVPKGATGQGLGKGLVEKGLIDDVKFWKFHLWQRGRDGKPFAPKAGKHQLSPSMTLPEIAVQLEKSPQAADEPFVMIEGWRLRDTDAALAAKGWIAAGDYIKATNAPQKFKAPFPLPTTTLEGYLYPETYRVIAKDDGKLVFDVDVFVQKQLDMFNERFWSKHEADVKKSGHSLDEIVKMASMLEREEPVPAQRRTVAGILWKRIVKNYALGVDATSRYTLAEWNDRKEFLKHLRDPDEPYNTRLKTGLPPTAIGAPTVESLTAACDPEDNEFFYYLHDSEKKIHPSRNSEEHEALRKQYNVY